MKESLNIASIQTALLWQDGTGNREAFSTMLRNINPETDLVILPEMFTTGFTMEAKKVAETMDGRTINWLKDSARELNVAITGSIIIKEDDRFYNRLLFVQPNGKLDYYDKRHLFSLAQEDKNFEAGTVKKTIEYKGWKIQPLICYDLRFPVWSRNTDGYELLIYVANWPKPRIHAWDTLLQARAIENMCYVAGVNRIGIDNEGHQYIGHSATYDMLGRLLTTKDEENDTILYASLEKSKLELVKSKLRFLDDRDSFAIT